MAEQRRLPLTTGQPLPIDELIPIIGIDPDGTISMIEFAEILADALEHDPTLFAMMNAIQENVIEVNNG